MEYKGTLTFTNQEYNVFMNGFKAVGYHPDLHKVEGRTIIVNNFEVLEHLGGGRYIAEKKWG